MRIDLVTPFAEKDVVKALGARWDAARRTWYVQNVADLTPFLHWIPAHAESPTPTAAATAGRSPPARVAAAARPAASDRGTVTQSVAVLAHCGCDVLPWEPCTHHR